MGNIARTELRKNSSSTRTRTFQKRTSSTLVVREIVVARPLVKLQHVFKNKKSNANYTLHWSVVWSLRASGWSLWTVTRCACVRLRAWHLSVRPAGSLQTTCHRPSAASSPLFVFVFSFVFVFLFVFARSLKTPCHRPSQPHHHYAGRSWRDHQDLVGNINLLKTPADPVSPPWFWSFERVDVIHN